MSSHPNLEFALVARGNEPLAEFPTREELNKSHGEGEDNPSFVTRRILRHHHKNNANTGDTERRAYQFRNHTFVLKRTGDLLVVVCSRLEPKGQPGLRIPFLCIEDIETSFHSHTDRGHPDFNNVFGRQLEQKLAHWNSPQADVLSKTREELDAVKVVMENNLGSFGLREEALVSLGEQAKLLEDESIEYKHEATNLKDRLWWKRVKTMVVVGVVCVVVIALVVTIVILV
jgi:hypothetical protein